MVTGRNVKSTWELAGRLAGSFETSTRRAQSQLSQLRREYSANQGELRRMQTVLKTAAQGTDAYANAQRRVPQLQEEISRQAFAISDVQKQALGGARAQGQMANATGRAGTALRALTTFGLAAGGAIGVAAGAVTLLTKSLNASGREAQALQTLSIRGIDPTAYQQASNRLQILTGDAATARRTVDSLTEAGQRVRDALAFDPRSLGARELRAISALGFDGPKAFAEATRDASGFVETLRGQLRGATQAQQDYIRAASVAAGLDPTLVDSILEENRLLERQAELRRQAAGGDASGNQELERIVQRLERIRTTQGIISPEQRDALERYDEVIQSLGLAGRDLKIAFTTSFADDLQAAAETLTRWITQASDLWDRINPDRPGRAPAEERTPTARDWADLVLTGGSGRISGRDDETGLGDFTSQIGRFAQRQIDAAGMLGRDVGKLADAILPSGNQRQSEGQSRVVNQTNNFVIEAGAGGQETGDNVVEALRRELARRFSW